MTNANTSLSTEDADRFRAFERQRHDHLATTYRDFFTPVTALAVRSLLDAARVRPGINLLDVATGPGVLAAEANALGIEYTGIDLSPGMIELAKTSYPGIEFHVADVEHLPFADASGAVRNAVGIRCGAFSGNMKVSFQAARSIG